ncbi:MAG TPA: RNA polymerase sigma factor region1.1 domain-containing protein [Microvirga sp.]|nr:RNA polymerase sigma factor region1.1 domain-containing protein [Microvirga sp.]
MRPAIDQSIFEGLISLGRQRGGLTNEDLRRALPIGAMSAEDIALVILQLEESGIPVDLDESLLMAASRNTASPRPSAEILPFPKRPRQQTAAPRSPAAFGAQARAANLPPAVGRRLRPAHWAVAGSILVLIVAAIFLLARGF